MRPTLPEWSDFRFFLALAREGRLLAASRALGVQHTTVARRIEALERDLGAPVFHRTSRGWRLTKLGAGLIPHAEQMEGAAREATARAQRDTVEMRGRVRIATVESWAWAWLSPRLPEFHARHPGVEIEILTDSRQRDLTRGEADLALRTPRPKQRELSAVLIAEGGVGLFARKDLAARLKGSFASLPPRGKGVPLGMFTHDYAFLQAQRAPWWDAFVAEANVMLVASNSLPLVSLAEDGHAVVPLPRIATRRSPSLVEVIPTSLSMHKIWLVTHPDVRRDPRVAAVAAFMKQIAKDIDER
ncbi:MAG: LysR family transcriptional regulator [Labilithrix sp.]